jgi:hypothetical protein
MALSKQEQKVVETLIRWNILQNNFGLTLFGHSSLFEILNENNLTCMINEYLVQQYKGNFVTFHYQFTKSFQIHFHA